MIEKILERLEISYHVNFNFHIQDDYRKIIDEIYDEVFKIVQEVAKEYGGGWIMVKDRLPEPHQRVLAFDVLGESITIESLDEDETFVDTVIAWMPLPSAPDWQKPKKPYDGEKCRSRSITAATADSYCNDGCDMQCPYEKGEPHEQM